MRLLSLLFLALTVVSHVRSTDKFETYQASSKSAPIELDDSIYADLSSKPRDYYFAVLLTALEGRYGCQLCREFQPEWDLLARSWNQGASQDVRLLFGTLDFSRGKHTFQKLMLQTAPVALLFPPTVGPAAKVEGSPFRYDFNGPVSAEHLSTWISRHIPNNPRPAIIRPVNSIRLAGYTIALLSVVTLFTIASPYILPVIQNRTLWASMCLIAILLFSSGHMFNHIRKVPYVMGDGKGGIAYFAPGYSSQLGLESQIVAATYGVLSFATIALAMKTPHIADVKAQQASVILWILVFWIMYSFLLSSFRTKNGAYPFYLPPF
ncbi:hypothetical protein VTO42DRAFT_7098 [Malbranchea cinnamomea]